MVPPARSRKSGFGMTKPASCRACVPASPHACSRSIASARAMRRARRVRHDHVVDVAALRGDKRREEALLVFPSCALRSVSASADIGAENDLDRTLGAHHRDLRRRPGVVDVASDMLRCHDVVGAAERLAGDHGDQRHRALTYRRTGAWRRA